MDCKDCAESENGKPAQACCPQCLDETFEHRRASAAFKGVEYDTGKRRFYGDEATALADHLELSGALSLLKDRDKRIAELEEIVDRYGWRKGLIQSALDSHKEKLCASRAMCAKLAEALKVALRAMKVRRLMLDDVTVNCLKELGDEEKDIEAALKEWDAQAKE